jgi:hypothetical protein
MPLIQQSKPDYGCIWVAGPPNSGKTTSLRTCEKPLGVISVPGEKGHSSAPYGEGVTHLRWEDDGVETSKRNTLYYMKIWREVEGATLDMINGKYGQLQTIVIDGIHKLYDIALAIATDCESAVLQSAFEYTVDTKGKEVLKGEFDPRCYGKSHKIIFQYVNMVASSKVPTRIFTSWSKMKKDDKKDTSRNAAEHLMPALPGEAGQMVLGEVGVTLHAKVNAKGEYVWQTKPGGDVAGAGIKGQIGVVDKIPMYVPQDFQVLAATIAAAKAA